jgi:glyoxylase-like metal-dependent hydrolase (beta-lactamase superfamily II)
VLDGTAHLPATQAVPGTIEDDWLPHHRFLDSSGRLPIELGGLLIRSGNRLVLVDTGVGPATVGPFTGGKLPDSLAAHGAEATAITDVVFTHLHFDHVG